MLLIFSPCTSEMGLALSHNFPLRVEDHSQIPLTSFFQLKQTLLLHTGFPQVCYGCPVHFIPVGVCLSHTEEPKSGPISLSESSWELTRRKKSLPSVCWLQSGIAQCLITHWCRKAESDSGLVCPAGHSGPFLQNCDIGSQSPDCVVASVWVCPKYRSLYLSFLIFMWFLLVNSTSMSRKHCRGRF